MNERFSTIPIDSEDKPSGHNENISPKKEISRRDFLKWGGAVATTTALGGVMKSLTSSDEVTKIYEDKVPDYVVKKVDAVAENAEKTPIVLTPLEQLQAYGEIRDMKAGLKVFQDEHYHTLTETKDGEKDMRTAMENISKYDVEKLIKPYEERGLPKELAYMIAIQETRGRIQKSHANARGMTGILPETALDLGFMPSDANDPYVASEMTAKYLATERDERFGDNNIDMLLHAYNAGGYLYGFTETVPRKERTTENFYRYMANYINTKFKHLKENGYRHILEDEKTIEQVSRRFEVPVDAILKANKLTKKSVIHKGDSILIPFENMEQAVKIVFRKPMQALQYAPGLKAKYKALKDTGFLSKIEKGSGATKSTIG